MKVRELKEILESLDPEMEISIVAPESSGLCEDNFVEYTFARKDIDTYCNVFTITVG